MSAGTANVTTKQLRRGFGPIYRALSRCGSALTQPEKLVLLNILERLGENDEVWPSVTTIARDTALNRTTVMAATAGLAAHGLITVRRLGFGKTNRYTVNTDVVLAWAGTINEKSAHPTTEKSAHPTQKIHQ